MTGPEPTQLQRDFISASEQEAEARSSAERQQVEELQKALREAETQRNQADAILVSATSIIVSVRHEMNDSTRQEVFALFQAGAEHGDANAMFNFGVSYRDGLGVERDTKKAREWFEKAADKGHEVAMRDLGSLYEDGQGEAQDYVKAREWYEKAADKGYAVAMLSLGFLYANAQGVAQDYVKAREWYEKAADKGDTSAEGLLSTLPIAEAASAGRHLDALRLQEALAVKTETLETGREGKPGEETARALQGVAWCALFAREFQRALIAAERAHALLPFNLGIETNRAHAMMFLKRTDDARALYLAHKGEGMSKEDPELWDRTVGDDFAAFRKAGLTHPLMDDIEKLLGVAR